MPIHSIRYEIQCPSSLIFNLCMAILSTFIEDNCIQGRWKAISFNNHLPMISHTAFANDIVIFGEAYLQNVQYMIRTIEWFCQASDKQINFVKSQVIFSESLLVEMGHFLFHEKGFLRNEGAITYLGFPFVKNARTITTLHQIKTKMQSKLMSWEFKLLSQASRMVLIQSMHLALPIYHMSCFKFPKQIINQLHSSISGFWRNQLPTQSKKLSCYSWDLLCKRKQEGGLGLKI